MKFDTYLMLGKLFAYTMLGGLVPMGTALQQWINTGDWPPSINWVGIWIGFGVGALTNFLAFFSSAWAAWKSDRNSNGVDITAKPTDVPKP